MKATKSILNIQSILKDFSGLAEARKSYTLRTRLVFIFCGVTIAMVLFFAHSVVNNAMNKILVVNEGGADTDQPPVGRFQERGIQQIRTDLQ